MSPKTPLLVGLVLLTSTVALTWFVLGTTKDRFSDSSTHAYFADFFDASGIREKTRLQINGIDVGKIKQIVHARTKAGRLVARVEIRVLEEYTLYQNASVRKAAESLLGDYRLDLDPGSPDTPVLPPGGMIVNVQSRSDLDEIQAQLREVTKNVNDVTKSFSAVLAGPEGEGSLKQIMESVERSMQGIEQTSTVLAGLLTRNDQVIDKMIGDLGAFSGALADASRPGGELKLLLENLARLSGKLDRVASNVENFVSNEDGGEARGRLQRTIDNINRSADALANVARKIDDGQGTLGRLVNDPALIDKVEATVDDAQTLLGGLSRVQTEIELRSQYEVPFGGSFLAPSSQENPELQSAVKNILGIRIVPRPDKYYLLEAASDPRGVSTRKIITTSEDGGDPSTKEIDEISYNSLKFSAQFAKRYYFTTLRFGIIENTGGLGANLHAFEDVVELRIDAFDFTRRDLTNRRINPRFRGAAMVEFVDHLWLQGGIDDPFNEGLRTWFFGGMLRFTDEDLKSLLTIAPSP
jgi:phospholipid/cholesterol/gamma-HCH transport system substrate-binding protein